MELVIWLLAHPNSAKLRNGCKCIEPWRPKVSHFPPQCKKLFTRAFYDSGTYWNGFLVSEYLVRIIDGSGRQKQIGYCHWSDWRRMQHCKAWYRHAQFQLMHLPKIFAFWLATHDARFLTNWDVSIRTFALPIMRLRSRIGPALTMKTRGFMLSFFASFSKFYQNSSAATRINIRRFVWSAWSAANHSCTLSSRSVKP